MALAHVGVLGTATTDGSQATTITCNTTGTVSAGNLIVAGVAHYNNVTCTLSGGSLTWTTRTFNSPADTDRRVSLAYALAPSGLASGTTLTATFSGAGAFARQMWLAQASGVDSSTPQDAVSAAAGTNASATWASGNLTTVASDTIMYGVSWIDFTLSTSTPATNYTEVHDFQSAAGNTTQEMVYRIVTASGTYTPGGTYATGGQQWVAGAVSFKAAAGGGGAPSAMKLPALGVG